ncbi:ATP-binding protein [Pseudoalteromonas gelatinilytica]
MRRIQFPKNLDSNSIRFVNKQLEATQDHDAVEVDLNNIVFSRPTAMLVTGSMLRRWREYRQRKNLKTRLVRLIDNDAHSYMGHVGFFDLIGSKKVVGKEMGEAKGSFTYTPITKIPRPSFIDLQTWYGDIISSVRGLANVLAGSPEDTEEHRFYLYTLRELVRNVFEHSEATDCYICGQRWSDGRVEISILDEGIGISRSLARSFPVPDDEKALLKAIRPGVSSTSNITSTDNIYDNSGFGLYVLSEIASSFGVFTIASNTKCLAITNGEQEISNLNFQGTFLGIELSKTPRHFSSLLKDIIYAGEHEAKAHGSKANASKMSKLL